MKLTSENIATIEAVLTHLEEGNSHRSTLIEFGLSDLPRLSAFVSVLRYLGIDLPFNRQRGGMSKQDRADFIEFLRQKKKTEK